MARRHSDVWVTWCQRGGIREVVSSLPAPPLGDGGIGEGAPNNPTACHASRVRPPIPPSPRTLKGGMSGFEKDRPLLDRVRWMIDGWRALLIDRATLGWVPPDH